jgi:hypothetical protein
MIHRQSLTHGLCSIVFVHGLTGTSYDTWLDKQTGVHWPTTLLSRDLADTCILTFGYDADVVNFWNPASQNRIGNYAENMIGALARRREQTNSVRSAKLPHFFNFFIRE